MPRQSQDYSWPFYAISGLLIRLAGIFLLARYEHISEHQLTLTDIDYKVYSDAGSYPSPYDRHTYRYPPIIAYINSYNYSHHETIGKILFALFDTVAIALLWRIFAGRQGQRAVDDARRVAKLYAFNPLFIYITVRGSCESVSMALMYAFWLLFLKDNQGNLPPKQSSTCLDSRTAIAYMLYGLWVHVRVYPIIFLPLLVMHYHHSSGRKLSRTLQHTIFIGLLAGGVFLFLAVFFYSLYGMPFLHYSYLYHLGRLDNRHSYSPYFYYIYLSLNDGTFVRSLIRTIPFLYILFSLSLHSVQHHSPFYLQFLLTFSFVTLNKVITMQYYMWIIGALLLVLPESIIFTEKKYQKGVGLTLQYLLGILLWTALSIKLEGEGENVFTLMWAICIFKLGMDLWVVLGFMNSVRRAKVAYLKGVQLPNKKQL